MSTPNPLGIGYAPRFQARNIERFLPLITQLAEAWPTVVVLHPGGLSSETFRARFRDACTAIRKHGVLPEHKPNVDKLTDLRVETHGTNLHIGSAELLKTRPKFQGDGGQLLDATVELPGLVATPTTAVLDAIIVLLEAGVIPTATLANTTESFVQSRLSSDSIITVVEQNGRIILI